MERVAQWASRVTGRRRLVILVIVALVGVGSASALAASAVSTRSNRRAAIRDASSLVRGVTAPAGAVLESSGTAVGPHGDHLLTPATASAVAWRSWRVAEAPRSVLSFVQAHLPAGSTVVSRGSGGPPLMRDVLRAWPAVPGVLDVRWLELQVTALADGETQLSARSQSQWVVTRPSADHIPARVNEVDVTERRRGKPPLVERRVTASATVHRLVALFNSLGIVQPGAINCPDERPTPTVTIQFRAAASARPLARATVSAAADYRWPATDAGAACFPIGLSIGGQRRDALVGNVIGPMQRLLHVRLARSR